MTVHTCVLVLSLTFMNLHALMQQISCTDFGHNIRPPRVKTSGHTHEHPTVRCQTPKCHSSPLLRTQRQIFIQWLRPPPLRCDPFVDGWR
mmetsp:Transcript_141466/g.271531  ORF Transcript_141466/g.271531 Transcript_141466/m.271531 type:complete len:90 (-) Transcript_141466:243-512(-)